MFAKNDKISTHVRVTVKGLTRVHIFVPKCFYQPFILQLIDSHISNGITSYDDLEEIDKDELTVKCMAALDNDAYVAITEADDYKTMIKYLCEYINHGGSDKAYDLAEKLRTNAISYFSNELNQLFQERLN